MSSIKNSDNLDIINGNCSEELEKCRCDPQENRKLQPNKKILELAMQLSSMQSADQVIDELDLMLQRHSISHQSDSYSINKIKKNFCQTNMTASEEVVENKKEEFDSDNIEEEESGRASLEESLEQTLEQPFIFDEETLSPTTHTHHHHPPYSNSLYPSSNPLFSMSSNSSVLLSSHSSSSGYPGGYSGCTSSSSSHWLEFHRQTVAQLQLCIQQLSKSLISELATRDELRCEREQKDDFLRVFAQWQSAATAAETANQSAVPFTANQHYFHSSSFSGASSSPGGSNTSRRFSLFSSALGDRFSRIVDRISIRQNNPASDVTSPSGSSSVSASSSPPITSFASSNQSPSLKIPICKPQSLSSRGLSLINQILAVDTERMMQQSRRTLAATSSSSLAKEKAKSKKATKKITVSPPLHQLLANYILNIVLMPQQLPCSSTDGAVESAVIGSE